MIVTDKYLKRLKKIWSYKIPKQCFDIKYSFDNKNNKIVCYIYPKKAIRLGTEILDNEFLRFKGVATYKDGDFFSTEKGKIIARKKAIRQYWKNLMRWTKEVYEVLNTALDTTECFIAYCSENINRLTKEICFNSEKDYKID